MFLTKIIKFVESQTLDLEIFLEHSQWNECSSSQRLTSLSAVVHCVRMCTIHPQKLIQELGIQ